MSERKLRHPIRVYCRECCEDALAQLEAGIIKECCVRRIRESFETVQECFESVCDQRNQLAKRVRELSERREGT